MPKTLNDIIPPSRRREFPDADAGHPRHARPEHMHRTPRRGTPWGTIIVSAAVVAVSAGILFVFSNAEVVVTQKTASVSVDTVLSATRTEGALSYEVVFTERIKGEVVPAESTENVQIAAQGTITIYNEQTVAQTLIKNTRFESPEGLIFRIHDSVSIPAGRPGAPGSVVATVHADEADVKYNIGPARFTVPGLRGGSAYTLVYAQSTSGMTGGFSGTRPTVSKATADAKREALRGALAVELSEAIASEVPPGHVLLEGATRVSYEALPDVIAAGGSVEVREKATARAVVFPAKELATVIAERTVGQYQAEPVTLTDTKDLRIVFGQDERPWDATYTTLPFTLSGATTLAWDVIPQKIASAVAGKTRDAAQVILTGGTYPEVAGARIILRPFWRTAFPTDATAITVTVAPR